MITPREIKILLLGLIFGIAYWFVFSGAESWWSTTFPSISTFWVGVIVIFAFLGIYKFKGLLPF